MKKRSNDTSSGERPGDDPSDDDPEMGEEWEAVIEREIELNTKHSPKKPPLEDLHLSACAVSLMQKEALPKSSPQPEEGHELETCFPEAVALWGRRCLSAYLRNDWEFFAELERSTSVWGDRRETKKSGLVQQAEVIRIAVNLFFELGRNPSSDELEAEVERAGIVVGAWNKTIRKCRLEFLDGAIKKPGRPKK